MYAAYLRDTKQAGSMLHASEVLLDRLDAPTEEFDQAVWVEAAGEQVAPVRFSKRSLMR
jgi:hypothetical protein